MSSGVRDKVFVGGLDYALTDNAFAAHCEQCGQLWLKQIWEAAWKGRREAEPWQGQSQGHERKSEHESLNHWRVGVGARQEV